MSKLAFLDDPLASAISHSEPDYLMSDPREPMSVLVTVQPDGTGFPWLDDDFVRVIWRVLQLPRGWAGAGSQAVTREALVGALEFIRRRVPVTSPRPSVVPTGPGGIQLEWHHSGLDVEIEFDMHGKVCDVAVADDQRGVYVSSDSLWEVVDELEMSLKRVDERLS